MKLIFFRTEVLDRRRRFLLFGVVMFGFAFARTASAAITWDGGAGTQWWFNPVNWNVNGNNNYWVPPSTGTMANDFNNNGRVDAADYTVWRKNVGGTTLTNRDPANSGTISDADYATWREQFANVNMAPTAIDTQINVGTSSLPGGEGVVFDPANDPGYASAVATTGYFPTDFGPQTFGSLSTLVTGTFYLSRGNSNFNLLTIKGNLMTKSVSSVGPTIGRSSGTAGVATNARVNQLSGSVIVSDQSLILGSSDTSNAGYGNGTWDYRGGTLEAGFNPTNQQAFGSLLLSDGSSAGAGGEGRFIMHNPATPGYVRAYEMRIAASARATTPLPANGTTTGIGTVEFHYENGNTRPIQVISNLTINNGAETANPAVIRSSRLQLVLDAAPTVTGGVPQDLGLFDVDFADPDAGPDPPGAIAGAGTNSKQFSNFDGTVLYSQGATVSAVFGSTQYNWTISYTGDITWVGNGDTGQVNSISDIGGTDIVLKGLSTQPAPGPGLGAGTVPEPSAACLACLVMFFSVARRHRRVV
jgi:hypothetical protein